MYVYIEFCVPTVMQSRIKNIDHSVYSTWGTLYTGQTEPLPFQKRDLKQHSKHQEMNMTHFFVKF